MTTADHISPRGITNVSQVSCHLTCALQLQIHGLEPLREALIEISRSKHDDYGDAFLLQLGIFFDSYSRGTTSIDGNNHDAAQDPSGLYKIMQLTTSIDPHHLGDAVTALRRILQAVRTSISERTTDSMLPSLAKIHESLLLGGTIRQEIIGRKGTIQRIKSKDWEMNCPFAITGSFASVEEGLELVTMQPRAIQGYNWDEATNYKESTIETESHAHEWETHKFGRFVSLPQHVMLHLQRFSHQVDGRTTPINQVVNIPLVLEMAKYFWDGDTRKQSHTYQLRGAILHVSDDNDDSDDDDDAEGGHYVSLLYLPNNAWYLLDDDTVTALSTESNDILEWLSGKSSAAIESLVPKKGAYTAVLLLYRRIDEGLLVVQQHLLDNLRAEIVERKQYSIDANVSLVGQRLRVRWSKGKYYAGVVTAYDESSGKHKVQYDDGDIKEYNLKKKIIEWESEREGI